MVGNRNKLLLSIFFILGPLILLLSEFTPWFSGIFSPWYIITTDIFPTTSKLIYYLPLISSIILLIVGFLFIIKIEPNKVLYISIIFLFLSFYIIFLIEMFSSSGNLLFNSIGVYVGFSGFILIFFGILWVLIEETPDSSRSDVNSEIISQ